MWAIVFGNGTARSDLWRSGLTAVWMASDSGECDGPAVTRTDELHQADFHRKRRGSGHIAGRAIS
jgi:hypothetical protein